MRVSNFIFMKLSSNVLYFTTYYMQYQLQFNKLSKVCEVTTHSIKQKVTGIKDSLY